MKIYICANCGEELKVKYSGIPGNPKARIVSSHECTAGKDEFVEKLNDLPPGKVEALPDVGESAGPVGTPFDKARVDMGAAEEKVAAEAGAVITEPGDRRDAEHVKSTAPPGLHESVGVPVVSDLPEEDEGGRQEPTGFPGSEDIPEGSEE